MAHFSPRIVNWGIGVVGGLVFPRSLSAGNTQGGVVASGIQDGVVCQGEAAGAG